MAQILIGSYTNKEKTGIYHLDFNEQKDTLTVMNRYDEVINPSYIIFDALLKSVYAVSETHGLKGGGIARYSLDDTWKLQYEGKAFSQGDDPCHLSRYHHDLIVGNYSSGNISIHSLSQQGQMTASKQTIQHKGHGPHLNRQESAHVHFISATPKADFVAVVDLGIDSILFYSKLEDQYIQHSLLQCEPGSGPRHLVFHQNLPLLYVVNELSSTVSIYRHQKDFKDFTLVQTISTIPVTYTENNQCAAIIMSQDQRHLYITNRGHDSIATYDIDTETGKLMLKDFTNVGGHWPRDCALTPSQEFLFVANELSDSVCVFKRDILKGTLTYNFEITISEPTCINFLS